MGLGVFSFNTISLELDMCRTGLLYRQSGGMAAGKQRGQATAAECRDRKGKVREDPRLI